MIRRRQKGEYRIKFLLGLFLLLFLVGCAREPLVDNLDQKQAQEIVATLASQGISSKVQKQRGSARASYSVDIASSDYSLAISILHALGLPKEAPPSFRELTEQRGFLPNTREIEAARLDYALGSEIEEKLRALPGVANASAVVRSNLIKSGEPSASIMVATIGEVELDPLSISKAVSMVIPGLQESRISVLIQQTKPQAVRVSGKGVLNQDGKVVYRALVPFFGSFLVPEGESQRLAAAILGILGLAGAVAFAAGVLFSARRNGRDNGLPAGGVAIARLASERTPPRTRLSPPNVKSDETPGGQ